MNVTLDTHDGIAVITLNRPDAGNSIDLDLARDLEQAANACDTDASVRAIVLTGAGSHFCFGGDIKTFAGQDDLRRYITDVTSALHSAISRLSACDAPVIAAIRGAAAGAGFSLACAADLAIAGTSSRFTMAYTRIGLVPDGSSTWFLPRLVGLRRAMELTLTNRTLTADEALDWGILNQVVADDEVLDTAMALAATFAGGPTAAYGYAKRLLRSTFEHGLETQMEHETRGITRASVSPDGREGVAAFLAKREPDFSGSGW